MTSLQPRNQPIQRWSRETVAVPGIVVQLDAAGHAVCMSKRKSQLEKGMAVHNEEAM
jgi:hypothetical protein